MKKLIYMGTLAFIAAGGLFWSCQKDEFETIPENGLKVKSAEQQDMECIDADGPYFEMCAISDNQVWANNKKSKQISYVVYNTDTKFVVKVKAMGNFDADATYTVTVNFGNSDVVLVKQLKGAGDVDAFEFDLPSGWQGGDEVSLKVHQEGGNNPVTLTASYYLVGICQDCEESFTYEPTSGINTYIFTYIPSESIESANLVFTFAQGVAVSGLDGWETNGSTRQINMDLTACETYTWTVTLTPDCNGKSNNSNVWTDFKVVPAGEESEAIDDSGEKIYSKKGSLANIEIKCPK